jgi:predicted ester cyclase
MTRTMSAVETDSAVQERANKELVRRYYDACNRRAMDEVFDCFHPELVHYSRLSEYPKDGVAYAFETTLAAFPDLRWNLLQLIAEDDRVAALVLIEGTHEGDYLGASSTGKRVKVFSAEFARVQDGMFIEHRGILDELHLIAQIGVVPEMYLAQMS